MKILRIVFLSIAAIGGLVVAIAIALLVNGYGIAHQRQSNPVTTLSVAPDTSLIERGRHLVEVDCSSCHSPGETGGGMTLSGGTVNFFDIPNGPKLGTMVAPNLTPGGVIKDANDGLIARSIREGVGFDSTPLLVMPSPHYHRLADRDVAALISYLRSQLPVTTAVPKRSLNALACLILGLRQAETSVQLSVLSPIAAPLESPDTTYGAYMVAFLGCASCHGAAFRGGRQGQLEPLGPNLLTLVKGQPFATFELALRHGVKPAGGALDPTRMPWNVYSRLTDLEVQAVYEFLKNRQGI